MQLLVCILFAWCMIILFAVTAKRLTILDFVFLYGVILSLTSTLYTMLELNFKIISIPITAANVWAVTVYRVITVPLLVLTALNSLQTTEEKKPQWMMPILIWTGLTTGDWVLHRFGMVTYHLSFVFLSVGLTYLVFIFILWVVLKWYKRFDWKAGKT